MKIDKVTVTQCIRTLVNIVTILVVMWGFIFSPTGADGWKIGVGTALLWFAIDTALTIYLEILFERER